MGQNGDFLRPFTDFAGAQAIKSDVRSPQTLSRLLFDPSNRKFLWGFKVIRFSTCYVCALSIFWGIFCAFLIQVERNLRLSLDFVKGLSHFFGLVRVLSTWQQWAENVSILHIFAKPRLCCQIIENYLIQLTSRIWIFGASFWQFWELFGRLLRILMEVEWLKFFWFV